MNRSRAWSVARVGAGAVVVAAATVAAVPQHAVGVARVLCATVTLVALVAAVVDRLAPYETEGTGPGTGTAVPRSPFERPPRRRLPSPDVPESLSRMRGELITTSVRADLAPLSPLAARRLAVIVDAALAREGLDPHDPAHAAARRARLSPEAWAAITARRTGRTPPGEREAPRRHARADEIAATVHAVLDEVERPASGRSR